MLLIVIVIIQSWYLESPVHNAIRNITRNLINLQNLINAEQKRLQAKEGKKKKSKKLLKKKKKKTAIKYQITLTMQSEDHSSYKSFN